MAIVQLYTHPELRVFRSSICSKATFFSIFSLLLSVIPPFFVAFTSRSFWIKEDYYRETPSARFLHKAIVILHGDLQNNGDLDYRLFTTYSNLRHLAKEKFMSASFLVEENSITKDNEILVKLAFFPDNDFQVQSVTLMLFFEFRLSSFVRVTMEGMAFIQSSTMAAASELFFDTELRLKQLYPLPHRGTVAGFDSPIVDENGTTWKDFELKRILSDYKDRDLRLETQSLDHAWKFGPSDPFTLEGRVRFREELIAYRPGIAQVLKGAWIQYLAIYVIFYFVIEKIKAFVFLNHIIPTIAESKLKLQ